MTHGTRLLTAAISIMAIACSGKATPADGGADGATTAAAFIGSLKISTIGSTVDPTNGDQNPYGLAIAPITSGAMTAGDLIICNFNDAANIQNNATTIEI